MGKIATSLSNAATVLDRSSGASLHRQLYEQLRAAILSGRLPAGTRLPSTREFAGELGIARNTVLNAFEQLMAESYLEARVGDGTYVSRQLPDEMLLAAGSGVVREGPGGKAPSLSCWGATVASTSTGPGEYVGRPRPFRTSTPALDAFPYKLWGRLLARCWRERGRELIPYGDPAGYMPLRRALASYLSGTRGVRCKPEQLVILSGSQHALDIVARLLVNVGDAAWVEDPGFLGARSALTAAGARLVPVPVDGEGMNVAAGVERCSAPQLIYVTPSHQYPLGTTLSLSRRLALLKFAGRVGAWVVEDDYDSEFRYAGRPLAALQGLDDDGRVIYIGTLSKVLFPSIRIGYVVAPPELADIFVRARMLTGHQSPALEQAALADFIADGHFARHVRRTRAIYAMRQEALLKAAGRELGGLLDIRPSEAGMHLMGRLPEGVDDRAAASAAAENGVEVTPLSAYCLEPHRRGGLRLGYTGYTPAQIRRGVRRLAAALRD